MTDEAIWLFRASEGRLPARATRASRAVSLGLHAVVALALVAPSITVPVRAQASAPEPEQRVLHVFVPPPPKEAEPQRASGVGGPPVPVVASTEPARRIDLEGVQLIVVGSAAEMVAALRAWKGTIGIAQASDPRVVVRRVGEHGSVESTEPVSLDLFWPVKVTDVGLRQQFGCGEAETLYFLFPEAVLDGVMEDLRRAVGQAAQAGGGGSARLVSAAYRLDAARGFAPAVDHRSLVWDVGPR